MAAGLTSRWKVAEATGIEIATEIATVTAIAGTTDTAADKWFRARPMTCTGTIARPTHAVAYNWWSSTAIRHAARVAVGDMTAEESGSTTVAGLTFRLAGKSLVLRRVFNLSGLSNHRGWDLA
jgi:hypothetical protein